MPISVFDDDTGDAIDMTALGWTFQFEIRRTDRNRANDDGYVDYYDYGSINDYGPILTASLGNGITILDVGVMQILIPEAMFRKLWNGTYQAALTATDGTNTRQIFIARLPVVAGGVTQ